MIFEKVIGQVMETYQPVRRASSRQRSDPAQGAIVLQCGADSLTGDRLGSFNLSLKGHGQCVDFLKKYGKPMLVLGGGGYTIRNVARCWAYETAVCCGMELPNGAAAFDPPPSAHAPAELPYNDYYDYYGPDFTLHITPSNMENLNTDKYLNQMLYGGAQLSGS